MDLQVPISVNKLLVPVHQFEKFPRYTLSHSTFSFLFFSFLFFSFVLFCFILFIRLNSFSLILYSYFVYAGLVFIPLVQPYLHEWEDWYNNSPRKLCDKAINGMRKGRKEKGRGEKGRGIEGIGERGEGRGDGREGIWR